MSRLKITDYGIPNEPIKSVPNQPIPYNDYLQDMGKNFIHEKSGLFLRSSKRMSDLSDPIERFKPFISHPTANSDNQSKPTILRKPSSIRMVQKKWSSSLFTAPQSVTKPAASSMKNRIKEEDLKFVINEVKRVNSISHDAVSKKSFKIGMSESYKSMFDRKESFNRSIKSSKKDHALSILDKSSTFVLTPHYNRLTFRKINVMRYRESIFRAASKLIKTPSFPDWSYQSDEIQYSSIQKLNVGGKIFEIFDDALFNLIHTKLSKCLEDYKSPGIPFFDRDYVCFNAILNFYRTGRLHLPPNVCLSFFEQELEFWGISENFMEPCCLSEFETFTGASNIFKKYGEDLYKEAFFDNLDQTCIVNLRKQLYNIMKKGSGNVVSRYVSTLTAFFIIVSILTMIISTTPFGRMNLNGKYIVKYKPGETVKSFLGRTKVVNHIQRIELLISGFFLAEIVCLYFSCPTKLELLSDTLNWVDFMAATSTIFAYIFTKPESTGSFEGCMLLLKVPRIFRLFKLTPKIRSGMDAFALTLRASANELMLVVILLIIMICIFGSLIFVTEMVNESDLRGKHSAFQNINIGMWWAVETMTAVGYGDYVPVSTVGYFIGSITIMIGVILCQLPVPIVLKNFQVYANQARARLHHKFTVRCIDPERISESINKPSTAKRITKRLSKIIHRD